MAENNETSENRAGLNKENLNTIQVVTFNLSDERYGLFIDEVFEVVLLPAITKVPHSPRFVKGVINLRGQIIPVIDMRIKFDLPEIEYNKKTRVIVIKIEEKLVGMIVDNVSQVIMIAEREIEPAPDVIKGLSKKYIRGIGRYRDYMVIILYAAKVLTEEEFEMIKQSTEDPENE